MPGLSLTTIKKQMHEGIIKNIVESRGFGFITSPNQPDFFFHCTALDGLEFGEQLIERRVRFDITTRPKGPRAVAVRAAD